jgi:uncharacterized membrane protein
VSTKPERVGASSGKTRLFSIDAVRGIAVVCMIQWHAAHSWLADRASTTAGVSEFFGGFAAPLFFALSGVSLGLTFPTAEGRARKAREGTLRALGIVCFAYGLDVWSWSVDRMALLDWPSLPSVALAWAAWIAGYGACNGEVSGHRVPRARCAAVAAVALGALLWIAPARRGAPDLLLRLDVLHGIGAALAIVTVVVAATASLPGATWLYAAISITLAASAKIIAGQPHLVLPTYVADWIARPLGVLSQPSAFPLVPWMAYTFAGVALGTWARGKPLRSAWHIPGMMRPWAWALSGLVLATVLWERSWPYAQWASPHPLLFSLFRLLFQAGRLATTLAVLAWLGRPGPLFDSLVILGRHSLLVYAVHLEFTYGVSAALVRHSLGPWQWAVLATLLVFAMTKLAWAAEARELRVAAQSKHELKAPKAVL